MAGGCQFVEAGVQTGRDKGGDAVEIKVGGLGDAVQVGIKVEGAGARVFEKVDSRANTLYYIL